MVKVSSDREARRRLVHGVLVAALVLLCLIGLVGATIFGSRQYIVSRISDYRHIGPLGVRVNEPVEIGGIRQWISIRGQDRRNPVLLVLHGGPGYTQQPEAWMFQGPWEEHFTVVQWDQRGAGKTYLANDPEKVGPTMTIPRMVADAEEMTDYLRRRFGQDRIVVVGHSWGSIVGTLLAKRRPEWLHAYVGMGQVVSMRDNERESYAFVLAEARRRGNATALAELSAIAPYPPDKASIEATIVQRKWLQAFGGAWRAPAREATIGELRLWSPDYSLRDSLIGFPRGQRLTLERLFDDLLDVDLKTQGFRFDCPMIFFLGRHDQNTPSKLAVNYFNRIEAPSKHLVWFERSAHNMYLEEPGAVLAALVTTVRPYTQAPRDRMAR